MYLRPGSSEFRGFRWLDKLSLREHSHSAKEETICFEFISLLNCKKIHSVSRFYINEPRWLFLSQFWPLLNQASFYKAAGAVLKIGLSLKPNHHLQFQLAQISEVLCSRVFEELTLLTTNKVNSAITHSIGCINGNCKWVLAHVFAALHCGF